MKTSKILFLVPLLLLILPLAHAATVQTATGSFVTNSTTTSFNTINGFTIITQNIVFTTAGDISGTLLAKDVIVISPTGQGFFAGSGTFTGTILGKSGSVGIAFTGTFVATSSTPPFTGQAKFVPGTGTGGLAGISGSGTIQGTINVSGTYSFQVTFRSKDN
ncbi:DUF3224 domain-containing protein [Candidatus Bathyarchaeota archaeon]|nr:MAG: DUF3224 domain-containing protein [Candidatus Bathyarchaeota archaeon]